MKASRSPVAYRPPRPVVRRVLELLVVLMALPILFVMRYLFLLLGAGVFWSAGLRGGAPLHAANAVFAALVFGGLEALRRRGVLSWWATVSIGALVVSSVLLPLVR